MTRKWFVVVSISIAFAGVNATSAIFAQPGDLFLPLPPDYCQVRAGLPATVGGTQGGAYCGPTSAADLLKWMNVNGFPLVGMWGNTEPEITAAILSIGAPANMNTGADSGTTTANMVRGLQTLLASGYPGQFDVGYIGRTSESEFERDLGRNFAWIKFHLGFGHPVIANIGWYDFQTTSNDGQRCGGHYVAMTGYDDDGVDLYARFRDPARDVNCAVLDATGCAGCGGGCGCVVRWKTSYDLVNLEDPENGCVMEPVFASKWFYNRSGKTCASCCENCGERLPYQDGFVYAGGVNVFSRPVAGMFIVGYNLAAGTNSTSNAGGSSQPTALAVHPFEYEVYHAHPSGNQIYKANPQSGEVTVFSTSASLNQPRRIAFGSDGMLYVLQGDTSMGFDLIALRRDGTVAGSAHQSTMGAFAYHEKYKRVYWWSGPSNQVQAYTPSLSPLGGPITLPSGPAFAAPGYMAADPTGDILYYNHDNGSMVFRFNTATLSPLSSISDTTLTDPADMVLDNRGHLYVAQEVNGPILEFDSSGNRVTNSAAANLIGNTVLGITRSVRTPLRDQLEQNPHNLNVDSVDLVPPPAPAAPPHDRRKNRYLSFDPNNMEAVAFELSLTDNECSITGKKCSTAEDCKRCVGGTADGSACTINSDCPGGGTCSVSGESCDEQSPPVSLGWIGEPRDPSCQNIDSGAPTGGTCTDVDFVSRVVSSPVTRLWTEAVVHVGDCEIAPVQTYLLRGSNDGGATFTAGLELATIEKPQGKFWGDVVGSFQDGAWTAPNGLVNVDDVVSWVKFVTLRPAPHITVLDLDGQAPNWVINATDLQFILQGFSGKLYPPTAFSNQGPPTGCP